MPLFTNPSAITDRLVSTLHHPATEKECNEFIIQVVRWADFTLVTCQKMRRGFVFGFASAADVAAFLERDHGGIQFFKGPSPSSCIVSLRALPFLCTEEEIIAAFAPMKPSKVSFDTWPESPTVRNGAATVTLPVHLSSRPKVVSVRGKEIKVLPFPKPSAPAPDAPAPASASSSTSVAAAVALPAVQPASSATSVSLPPARRAPGRPSAALPTAQASDASAAPSSASLPPVQRPKSPRATRAKTKATAPTPAPAPPTAANKKSVAQATEASKRPSASSAATTYASVASSATAASLSTDDEAVVSVPLSMVPASDDMDLYDHDDPFDRDLFMADDNEDPAQEAAFRDAVQQSLRESAASSSSLLSLVAASQGLSMVDMLRSRGSPLIEELPSSNTATSSKDSSSSSSSAPSLRPAAVGTSTTAKAKGKGKK